MRLTRAFITVSLLLAMPQLLWSATLVQSRLIIGSGGDPSLGLAYTSSVTSGSCLIAACAVYLTDGFSTTNPAFTDTQTNTWTVSNNEGVRDPNSLLSRIYMARATAGSSAGNTVTCNPPGASSFITLVILEYSGMSTCTPDQVSDGSGGVGGTAVSSGSTPTTTQADETVVGAMTYEEAPDTTITVDSPCVSIQENEDQIPSQPIAVCDYTVGATGAQVAAWTLGTSKKWAAVVLTLKHAAVVGGTRRGQPIVFP